MDVKYTNGNDPDFVRLSKKLGDYLNRLAGGEMFRQAYVPLNALDNINDAYVIYDEDVPIACGGFKHHSQDTAEIKRVFVEEAHRNKGIARQLMKLLESMARTKGYQKLIVETGRDMHGAVNLYKTIGYIEIPNYGSYENLPNSICMEKAL